METALVLSTVALVLALLAQFPRRDDRGAVSFRLTEIERRQRLIMDHLGIVDRGPALPGVREHLARGDKIKAIKAYREATGTDLRTAKEAVEAIAAGR
ncbi:hypothetical protein [Micromonospora rifamycinica]|uniref:LSU ribosomal protein L12P homologue n=1 Tax=Micromonospora rifamycinica TaxID=291594 RepID=A0A120F8U7_9ACTN|nr:hypothetical protein [Micromonospora rifamycinica]KWV32390.1 hypothetical protein AWV63_12625 [Micromonospora rifamycinica]SCG52546.1 LSU ribosomal protein L12P homologue [Micromonospora rifamycinica]